MEENTKDKHVQEMCSKIERNCDGDIDKLNKTISEFVVDEVLSEYKYDNLNISMPNELRAYNELCDEDKRKMNEKSPMWMANNPSVKKYMSIKSGIEAKNKSNYEFLKECIIHLGDDNVRIQKIKFVLQTHETKSKPMARVDWNN